jgi:hypothetical protein
MGLRSPWEVPARTIDGTYRALPDRLIRKSGARSGRMDEVLRKPVTKIVVAALLVLLAVQGVDASTGYTQVLYRDTAFSTQRTDYLCTAAVVQNIVNLAIGSSRGGMRQQLEFYDYGLEHNLYDYAGRGVDPQGMEAMLELWIPGSDWGQVSKQHMQPILRMSARQMRATELPVVLFVGGGAHVWTMNGYTSTVDPASGKAFDVTHVRFSGPLYPRTIGRHGWFDLEPNTRRTSDRFINAFFPYREWLAFGDHRDTPWNGYYVAIVPLTYDPPDEPPPTPTPEPSPDATLEPTAQP